MAPNTYPNMLMADPSMREHRAGRYPSQPRNPSHRSNFVPHPRGDGHRWYGTGRDVNVQSHRGYTRGFMRSSPPNPPSTPFRHPVAHSRPFMTHVPYHEMAPLYYPGVPVVYPNGPAFPVFYPVPQSVLESLVSQIEYYFSDDNLAKDEYLKSNMDNEGWVPISLIAGFPRVKSITGDAQLILNSLTTSKVVEVQDGRIRRRSEWMKWVWASGLSSSDDGSPSVAASSQNPLTASLQNMALVETTSNSSHTDQPEHPDGHSIDNAKPNHG
ncbi:hypothetical protein SAY86_006284 [Trapa natans]|uniref:HTH La-type RNA-binding domain-containing protein n=1 Tax=Trapa natans TaxID=22666 RepID=A0AAN7QVV2_TRANT|nr:hypothetical protein SAY86_006284 [Trapa natans]